MVINDIEYISVFNYALNSTLLLFVFIVPLFVIFSLFFYFKRKNNKGFNKKEFLKGKIILFVLLFFSVYVLSFFNILLKDLESIDFEKTEIMEEYVFDIVSITESDLKLVYKNDMHGSSLYINDKNFENFKINNETYENKVVRTIYKGLKLLNFKDRNLFIDSNLKEEFYYIDEETYNKIKDILDSKYLYKKED